MWSIQQTQQPVLRKQKRGGLPKPYAFFNIVCAVRKGIALMDEALNMKVKKWKK